MSFKVRLVPTVMYVCVPIVRHDDGSLRLDHGNIKAGLRLHDIDIPSKRECIDGTVAFALFVWSPQHSLEVVNICRFDGVPSDLPFNEAWECIRRIDPAAIGDAVMAHYAEFVGNHELSGVLKMSRHAGPDRPDGGNKPA